MHSKVQNSKSKISHTTIQGAKIFAPCETPSWHTSGISHSPNQFSHNANQGAKFIPTCENHSSRCEFSKRQFRTPLFKVRNTSLAHECHHLKYRNGFAPCETRCKNFAQCEIECETRFKVQNSQFKVRKFRTVKFKVRKFRTMKF